MLKEFTPFFNTICSVYDFQIIFEIFQTEKKNIYNIFITHKIKLNHGYQFIAVNSFIQIFSKVHLREMKIYILKMFWFSCIKQSLIQKMYFPYL